MTRIYDFNLALRQKRQVKHVAAMIFLRTLKIFAAYVEKRCLIRNGSNPWFNLASALILSVIVEEISYVIFFLNASVGH